MTTREQWLALAERCEKATGLTWQDAHELGASIALAAGWTHAARGKERSKWWRAPGAPEYARQDRPPRLATSLDAITTLIERELPGSFITCLGRANEWTAGIRLASGEEGLSELCATETLARCAAFCRAMSERAEA